MLHTKNLNIGSHIGEIVIISTREVQSDKFSEVYYLMTADEASVDFKEHIFCKVMCAHRRKRGDKLGTIVSRRSNVKRREKTINRHEHQLNAKKLMK